MINIKLVHSFRIVSFSCVVCKDLTYPCISCQQERSVYDLAYMDGKNGVEKIKDGLNSNHNAIFDIGYSHGVEDKSS